MKAGGVISPRRSPSPRISVAKSSSDRVAFRVLGPKRLVLALPVVIDDRRGQRQDASGRTIVLLELDDPCARIVLLEIENVPDVGPTPTIDRVVNKEPAGHIVAEVFDGKIIDKAAIGQGLHLQNPGFPNLAISNHWHRHSGPQMTCRHELECLAGGEPSSTDHFSIV